MPKKVPAPTEGPRERALLIGVVIHNRIDETWLSIDDSLTELALLADTANLNVVDKIVQKRTSADPKTFIGQGKLNEIKTLIQEKSIDVIIFDEELTPRHQRELEKVLGDNVKVLDRTALILDIFAQHAHTREGALQVELAQYEYRLPRLTRAWTHLARQAGGGGGRIGSGGVGLRGPGETQLEVDRREIRRRINQLRQELEKVREHRKRHRMKRKRSEIPVVSLVGYTNAGKSTLLNYLAKADVYVADKLFATLDPTTRKVRLPGGNEILMTDTVGFIQKLPTSLVAAFRATLEEIAEADLLLHVVDINHENAQEQLMAVNATIEDLGASHIPKITVLNKIDLLPDPERVLEETRGYENAVAISAKTGKGVKELLQLINQYLFEKFVDIDIFLPYEEGRLLSMIHRYGYVESIEHKVGGIAITGKIPGRLMAEFNTIINAQNN